MQCAQTPGSQESEYESEHIPSKLDVASSSLVSRSTPRLRVELERLLEGFQGWPGASRKGKELRQAERMLVGVRSSFGGRPVIRSRCRKANALVRRRPWVRFPPWAPASQRPVGAAGDLALAPYPPRHSRSL